MTASSSYVYAFFRPDTGEPCYIGKGSTKTRWCDFKRRGRGHLSNIIKKYGGQLPAVKIRTGLTEDEAFTTEMSFINAIGRADLGEGPLVNKTNGGEGARGWVPTPEVRARMSATNKVVLNRPETRARVAAATKVAMDDPNVQARWLAATRAASRRPEVRAKMSAVQLIAQRRPETRAKVSATVKIVMNNPFFKYGLFVRRYFGVEF